MGVKCDYELASLPLPVNKGVAAFDPVTLHLAAERFNKEFVDENQDGIVLATRVAGELPQKLTGLAQISVSKVPVAMVKAKIDTGKLTWNTSEPPAASSFDCYSGRAIASVSVKDALVMINDETPVVRLPLKLADGNQVFAWFAELEPSKKPHIDGLKLVDDTRYWMREWETADKIEADRVEFPCLQLAYESKISQVASAPFPVEVSQEFRAALDETGVRVVAVTVIGATCMPVFPDRVIYEFGKNGPVLFWLSETSAQLPFSIFYTTEESWLDEGEEVGWDEELFDI